MIENPAPCDVVLAHRYVPLANNPFEALHNLITFSSKDFAADRTDAWIYGIVVGWDNEDADPDPEDVGAMDEIAATYGWDAQTVAQLRELRSQWIQHTAVPTISAPSESRPWPTWQEVPDGMVYVSEMHQSGNRYVNRDGARMNVLGAVEYPSAVSDTQVQHLAPFVSAEVDR
ncbi:hypothetical protein ACU5JM_19665 [Rhodococcus erythropolis]|uniref:hypothetical protein n=1 Tax=Rhodococcus erythropolis TaxID=1833 RepID=UPI00406BB9AE